MQKKRRVLLIYFERSKIKMSKGENVPMMYERFPAVAALNRVQGFNPLKMMRRMVSEKTGEEVWRLDLQYKKLWFRLAHPTGRIRLNALRITEQLAIYEAQVYLNRDDQLPISSFTSSISREEAPEGKYVQAAQEEAVDNALTSAGFGIQLSDVTTPENQRHFGSEIPVSAAKGEPAAVVATPKPAVNAGKPAVQAPTAPAKTVAAPQSAATAAAATPKPAQNAPVPSKEAQSQPAAKPAQTAAQPSFKAPKVNTAVNPTAQQDRVEAFAAQPVQPVKVDVPAVQTAKIPEQKDAHSALEILRGGNVAPTAAPTPAVAFAAEADADLPYTFGPRYNNDMSVDEIAQLMTVDEAKEVVVDSGMSKGWKMGDIAANRPASLKFYIFGGYKGNNNILKAAAKIMYEQVQQVA